VGEMLKTPATRATLSDSVDSVERWPLVVFVASALICLGFSVAYHLFGLSEFGRMAPLQAHQPN